MGKALIIPGADFSQNAIKRDIEEWYTPSMEPYIPQVQWSSSNYLVDSSFYRMSSWDEQLAGRIINTLKVRKNPSESGGGIRICVYEGITLVTSIDVPITLEGYNQYKFQDINIGKNQVLAVICYENKAAMRYENTIVEPSLGHSLYLTPEGWVSSVHTIFEIEFGYTNI